MSTPDSTLQLTIWLDKRETTWGRGGDNSIIHPLRKDVRVPRHAFNIHFWKDGLPKLIRQGVNWTDVPDVSAMVMTRSSNGIQVNGVQLRKGKKGIQYGKLYTDDVISVCREIKFVCQFYHGASAGRRPEGSAFEVREG